MPKDTDTEMPSTNSIYPSAPIMALPQYQQINSNTAFNHTGPSYHNGTNMAGSSQNSTNSTVPQYYPNLALSTSQQGNMNSISSSNLVQYPSLSSNQPLNYNNTFVVSSTTTLAQDSSSSNNNSNFHQYHRNYPQQDPAPPGYLESSNIPPPPYNSQPSPMTLGQMRDIQIVMSVELGPHPLPMQCPHCRVHIVSSTQTRAGLLAWLVCGILALIGCWPCCILPFCVPKCQDVHHFCPNCNAFLGTYRRI